MVRASRFWQFRSEVFAQEVLHGRIPQSSLPGLACTANLAYHRTEPELPSVSAVLSITCSVPAKTIKRRAAATKHNPRVEAAAKTAVGRYSLEPLNPWLNCGPDTTVTELWKVRERRGSDTVFHLVYLDRYGWYCEHGRNCAAVPEARRAARELAEITSSLRGAARNQPKRRK